MFNRKGFFKYVVMKVTILKHHEGYNPNQEVDVPEEMGLYWIATGVATMKQADNESIEKSLHKNLKKTKNKK